MNKLYLIIIGRHLWPAEFLIDSDSEAEGILKQYGQPYSFAQLINKGKILKSWVYNKEWVQDL